MKAAALTVLFGSLAAGSIAEERSESAKIWIEDPEFYEDVLRNGEIAEVHNLGSGRNHPRKVSFETDGRMIHGVWKPITRGRQEWAWESYQAEVAAYEMDRLLGLKMVPPTVVREIGGRKGSLQLWVEGCKLFRDVSQDPPENENWRRQVATMKLFDNLISNSDRSSKNYMVDERWNIVLIDHSQAFLSKRELEDEEESLPRRFDRGVVEALRKLRSERLRLRLDRILMEPQIEAIGARRKALLQYVDALVDERGEDAVFY